MVVGTFSFVGMATKVQNILRMLKFRNCKEIVNLILFLGLC